MMTEPDKMNLKFTKENYPQEIKPFINSELRWRLYY